MLEVNFIKKRGRKKKKGVQVSRNLVKNFQQVHLDRLSQIQIGN